MSFYGVGLNAKTFGAGIQWFSTSIKQTVLFFNLYLLYYFCSL